MIEVAVFRENANIMNRRASVVIAKLDARQDGQFVLRKLLQLTDASSINSVMVSNGNDFNTLVSKTGHNHLICDISILVIEGTGCVEMQIPAVPKRTANIVLHWII